MANSVLRSQLASTKEPKIGGERLTSLSEPLRERVDNSSLRSRKGNSAELTPPPSHHHDTGRAYTVNSTLWPLQSVPRMASKRQHPFLDKLVHLLGGTPNKHLGDQQVIQNAPSRFKYGSILSVR